MSARLWPFAFAALLALTEGCKSGGGRNVGELGSGGGIGAAGANGTGGVPGSAGAGNEAGAGGVTGAGGAATGAGGATTSDGGAAGSGGATAGDGGAIDGAVDSGDPFSGSETDTTLPGTDRDGNGVRDDVDAYIATLEADARKKAALLSFARESTAMMVLGGSAGTTKAAAVGQAQRVGRTIDCLHDLYLPDLKTKQAILQNVRNALYDNGLRLRAYNHASTLLSGTILRAGQGCDPTITRVPP